MDGRQWAKRYIDSSLNIVYQDEPIPDWVVQFSYWEKPLEKPVPESQLANSPRPTIKTGSKDRAYVAINPTATQARLQKLLKAYQDQPDTDKCPNRMVIRSLELILYEDNESCEFDYDIVPKHN